MSRKESKIIKAYFESSLENDNDNLTIVKFLNKNNCNVMQTVIGSDLNFLSDSGSKSAINIFANKIKDIIDCDVFICEISNSKPSLYFLAFEALKRKKPVLALHREDGFVNEKWLEEKYDFFYVNKYDIENLEEIVSSFISTVQKKVLTSRFTIRLNEELTDYTDYLKSRYGCSSRNEVIFKLLNERKNEDYPFKVLKNE